MSDDLDDLKRLLIAATPEPDAVRRARNIARAEENFRNLQGSQSRPRPSSSSIWNGVRMMFTTMTSRGGLTASTALVACGLMFTPAGQQLWRVTDLPVIVSEGAPAQTTERLELRNVSVPELDQSRRGDLADQPADSVAAAPIVLLEVAPKAEVSDGTADSFVANTGQLRTRQQDSDLVVIETSTESFPQSDDNPLKITLEEPVSTFSIDVDTASYSFVRNSILRGQLPPRDAVRVEEMVNYFPYDYPTPESGAAPFLPTIGTLQTPWNPDTRLVQIAIQGELPEIEARPPLNLVFLIDTSGSMNDPAKLPLLRQSFLMMLDELRPEDEVSIVTYAGSAGRVLDPTPAAEKSIIVAALMRLSAGGSTNGIGGLEQAYATAEEMTGVGEVSRVILATDGDFNVGISDPEGLTQYVNRKRESGTYLSVLGFGRGNIQDTTMQALAQNGNGVAAYIDTLAEARKVLVDQLTGSLFTIAGDVKVQVEWNPAKVAEYRLIGFETRSLNREDFNNDAVDAGELGAGHSMTALYEITPVGSPAQLSDPLRYQAETVASTSDELGYLKMRYKEPGEDRSRLIETPITETGASNEAQFAAAIAGFGQLLRGSSHLNDWSYEDAVDLAQSAMGEDAFGYRAEAIQLMRLAAALNASE